MGRLSSERFLSRAVMAALAAGLAISLLARPSTTFDPGMGFLTWTSMQQGAPWNSMVRPDPNDIAHDRNVFNAWWTPGQYAVPAALTRLGLPLGWAMWLVGALCLLAGVFGYRTLFRALGLSDPIPSQAALVLALAAFAGRSLAIYEGGEALIFAGAPWITLAVWRWRRLAMWQMGAIFGLFVVGVFLKASFILVAAGALVSVILATLGAGATVRAVVVRALRAGILWTALVLGLQVFYLSRGLHPDAHHLTVSFLGLVQPISGGLLDGLFNGLLDWGGRESVAQATARLVHAAGAVGAIGLVWFLWGHRREQPHYTSVALGFFSAFAVLMFVFYQTGADVSHEGRHFRPLGAMLLPGLLLVANDRRNRLRPVIATALALSLFGGPAELGRAMKTSITQGSPGLLQFTQVALPADALHALHSVDDGLPSDVLLAVQEPELALEVRRHRVVTLTIDPEYKGRVETLVVLENHARLTQSEIDARLHEFADYRTSPWREASVGTCTFYIQGAVTEAEIERAINSGAVAIR